MKRIKHMINDPAGMHIRPAGALAKKVKSFENVKVTIAGNGEEADAADVMALMMLGLKRRTEIELTVEGEHEEAAALELSQFLEEIL